MCDAFLLFVHETFRDIISIFINLVPIDLNSSIMITHGYSMSRIISHLLVFAYNL